MLIESKVRGIALDNAKKDEPVWIQLVGPSPDDVAGAKNLRDEFAKAILPALYTHAPKTAIDALDIARAAYLIADAMIEVRNGK